MIEAKDVRLHPPTGKDRDWAETNYSASTFPRQA
jgi:hypothetical protein